MEASTVVSKYITSKKGKHLPSQERYLDWKKVRHSEIKRFELAHAPIILSLCGIMLHAEIKQNAACGGGGVKKAHNHATKCCLIICKYSSYFLERSLGRPKERKKILCIIIIISPQMHHDHWSNQADLDYGTSNTN